MLEWGWFQPDGMGELPLLSWAPQRCMLRPQTQATLVTLISSVCPTRGQKKEAGVVVVVVGSSVGNTVFSASMRI